METHGITITRRNLPHWHKDHCIQFVTFHLADSLPAKIREDLQKQKDTFIKEHPKPWTTDITAKLNTLFPTVINNYLDAGYGNCHLRRKDCAQIMAEALEYFDNIRYLIHRYVVMPNHVHILVELMGTYTLSQICKSWKNFSALKINQLVGATGKLWHHESWDRLIRNERHYNNVVSYIEKNINEGGIIWR